MGLQGMVKLQVTPDEHQVADVNLPRIESSCTVTARLAELAYAVSGLEAGKEMSV